MAYINHIDEDTVEITRRMSDDVKYLPTFTQWKLWLNLTRPEHANVMAGMVFYTCIACGIQFDEYPDARRRAMRPKWNSFDPIRIGALVRTSTEDIRREGRKTIIERGHRVIPVSKTGIGCETCRALFADKATIVASENDAIDEWNRIKAILTELKGCANEGCGKFFAECQCSTKGLKFKPHTFTSKGHRLPQITMFENYQCMACKDTFHTWDKDYVSSKGEVGAYVICSCYNPDTGGQELRGQDNG